VVEQKRKKKQQANGPHLHITVVIATKKNTGYTIEHSHGNNNVKNLDHQVQHPRKQPPVKRRDRKFNIDVEVGGNAHDAHLSNVKFIASGASRNAAALPQQVTVFPVAVTLQQTAAGTE
jgi:hypothetical protein